MRCTVPVPMPSDLATFKIPTPFASSLRTFVRSCCLSSAGRAGNFGVDCSRNVYNPYSRRRAGKVFPHEIDIQETDPKHRKLDSQAALPHPTRDRAADGLGQKAWTLRTTGWDYESGVLHTRCGCP